MVETRSSTARSRSKPEEKRWRKILYERQPFSDDYTPDCFLKELKKTARYYSLTEIIVAAGRLTQEVAVIACLIAVFLVLAAQPTNDAHWIQAFQIDSIYSLVALWTVFFYLWLYYISRDGSQHKSALIFLVSGFALSPILKTLTETISTDTICSMVILMMAVHLMFYDYGVQCAIVSTPISLNAGIFGAVCLASRLSNTLQALTFLIWALDLFVMFTIIRNKIRDHMSLWERALFTALIVVISAWSIKLVLHWIYFLAYVVVVAFINFIFPFGFYILQPLKETFIAPWDEAVIETKKQT